MKKRHRQYHVMADSMTPTELDLPLDKIKVLKEPKRIRRVARGCGVSEYEVLMMLMEYERMAGMMRGMGGLMGGHGNAARNGGLMGGGSTGGGGGGGGGKGKGKGKGLDMDAARLQQAMKVAQQRGMISPEIAQMMGAGRGGGRGGRGGGRGAGLEIDEKMMMD